MVKKTEVKECDFYCCSSSYSHCEVVNNESNSYN